MGTVSWKKMLLVGLIVLIVLIGLPMLMPGMSPVCHECGPAVTQVCQAVAALVGSALLAALVATFIFAAWNDEWRRPLRTQSLYRPPRVV